MDLGKLVTLSFDPNVGPRDRVFRLISGGALAATGWVLGLSLGPALGLTIGGVMWFATGVRSRCTIYYVLGHSTCPIAPVTPRAGT